MGKEEYTLHFYPADKRLDVKSGTGSVVASFAAWGSDMTEVAKGTPRYEPTNKGTFIVQTIGPITTSGWEYSKVAWGERVKIRTTDFVVFDLSGKKLVNLGIEYSKDAIKRAYADMPAILSAIDREEDIVVPYRFNDFGHKGIKTYTDVNNNKKYDNNVDRINPHYIHSTTIAEWDKINNDEKGDVLHYSHGCIHMYPSDIDTLVEKYIVRTKTTLTVH